VKKRSVRMVRVAQGEEFEIDHHERSVTMETAIGGGMLVFIAKEDDVT
jgi:hypothetical protein